MPYLQNGQIVAQRSHLRPGIIVEFIWKLFNFIGLFFGTLSAKTPSRKRKKERGFHNYLGGTGGGGGAGEGATMEEMGGVGEGRTSTPPNLLQLAGRQEADEGKAAGFP